MLYFQIKWIWQKKVIFVFSVGYYQFAQLHWLCVSYREHPNRKIALYWGVTHIKQALSFDTEIFRFCKKAGICGGNFTGSPCGIPISPQQRPPFACGKRRGSKKETRIACLLFWNNSSLLDILLQSFREMVLRNTDPEGRILEILSKKKPEYCCRRNSI